MADIYFNENYGRLYDTENEKCEKFVFECSYGKIINIFIKREIEEKIDGVTYYDVITPYGYGGPFAEQYNDIEKLTQEYNKAWSQYCEENRIVSEFVRFHLYDNENIRSMLDMDVVEVCNNVVVDTTYPMEETWMRFEHKVRKNVNKARKNELTVLRDSTGEKLDDFLRIYYDTMKRNNALDMYYFKKSYFEQLNETLKGNFIYFHVMKDGKVIATELVLCSENYAYSFLGGTDSEYYDLRPNDLLKYDVIEWCNTTGRSRFILGGGYHKDDGIYRYKKSLAPDGDVMFFVGKKIRNEAIYNNLVELRSQKPDFDEESNFFPLYRS